MMVSVPMTLSWIVCLDIHINAALTACISAKVTGVWFGKLAWRRKLGLLYYVLALATLTNITEFVYVCVGMCPSLCACVLSRVY